MLGKLVFHRTIERQYPNLVLPDSWENVQKFCEWYLDNGKPILVPHDARVIHIENATSIPLFRHGRFQVEMYIVYPGKAIPSHSHPGVDIVTLNLGGGNVLGGPHPIYGTSVGTGRCLFTAAGESHSQPAMSGGYALLSFEHWKEPEPSSAAIQWDGESIGPEHESIRAVI